MTIQRLGLALALVGATALFGLLLHDRSAEAKAVPAVVRAQTIELVGPRGRVRAQLRVEAGGQVVFRLRDASGTVRVKLGADANGSGLLLLDETTEPGVHLLATRNSTSITVQRAGKRREMTP